MIDLIALQAETQNINITLRAARTQQGKDNIQKEKDEMKAMIDQLMGHRKALKANITLKRKAVSLTKKAVSQLWNEKEKADQFAHCELECIL